MATYAISDIHGHDDAFRRLLKRLKLKRSDRLILLGDYIDRGPQSKNVLDTIQLLKDSNFSLTCLLGNHEHLMLRAKGDFESKMTWIRNGGQHTLASFLTSDIQNISQKYFNLLNSFQSYHEEQGYIFVHAGINMLQDKPLDDMQSLLWLRNWKQCFSKEWLGERKVIHGHTPMKKEQILNQLENDEDVICIDNGCFQNMEGFGSLCAFNISDRKFYFENCFDDG